MPTIGDNDTEVGDESISGAVRRGSKSDVKRLLDEGILADAIDGRTLGSPCPSFGIFLFFEKSRWREKSNHDLRDFQY